MLITKRYEYLEFDKIKFHPSLVNHRTLNQSKISHLEKDILQNGLLEPLVVWERNSGEYYLVGGYHRINALMLIRKSHPGYFDRVDVRVVSGDPDEIKALNLKLNADRIDTKITDYFETVIYLNNSNWSKERIAEFLDKSVSWIEEILKYAPMVTPVMNSKLETGELSWNRAKQIIQEALQAPIGKEKVVLENALSSDYKKPSRLLTFRSALSKINHTIKKEPEKCYTFTAEDLLSLLVLLQGKQHDDNHVERVKKIIPELIEQ